METDQRAASFVDVVARVGERVVTLAELERRAGNKMLRVRLEEYKQRRQVLDELIGEILLEREAQRRGENPQSLLMSEVETEAAAPSPADVRRAYEAARGQFNGTSEADALRTIAARMRRQRVGERRRAFVAALRRDVGVRVTLEPPRVAVGLADGPTRGRADALVTIVEFSDFQCPYSARMASTLVELQGKYPGLVRLVFRDYPLPIHAEAGKAAEAAACAGEQGKYWVMHDRLFQNQAALKVTDLKRYSLELGLNTAAFDACLDSGQQGSKWRRDQSAGREYGVTATPSIFINGRPEFGALPLSRLSEIVDEELELIRARPGR